MEKERKYLKKDIKQIEKLGFKARLDNFFTEPLRIGDLDITFGEFGDLTIGELKFPLDKLLKEKSPCKFRPALKIIENWLVARKQFLPSIFKDTTRYRNIVVTLALYLSLYRIENKIALLWFYQQIIERVSLKDLKVPYDIYGEDDLKNMAVSEIKKIINERFITKAKDLKKRIEPYLRVCVKNLLRNFYKGVHAQKRFPSVKIPLDKSKHLPEHSIQTFPEEVNLSLIIQELQEIVTPRQLDIITLRYSSPKLSNREIAEMLGCSKKTIDREMKAIRSNKRLARLYRSLKGK